MNNGLFKIMSKKQNNKKLFLIFFGFNAQTESDIVFFGGLF
jgi:hypothetical protein